MMYQILGYTEQGSNFWHSDPVFALPPDIHQKVVAPYGIIAGGNCCLQVNST